MGNWFEAFVWLCFACLTIPFYWLAVFLHFMFADLKIQSYPIRLLKHMAKNNSMSSRRYYPQAFAISLIALSVMGFVSLVTGQPIPNLFAPENTVFFLKAGFIAGTIGAITTLSL